MLSRALALALALVPAALPAAGLSAREIGPGEDWRIVHADTTPDGQPKSWVMVNVGNGLRIEGDRRATTVAALDRDRITHAVLDGRMVTPTVVRFYTVVDCKANTSRRAITYVHDWTGRVLTEDENTEQMKPAAPGTASRTIVDVICGREAGLAEPGLHPWLYLKDHPTPPRAAPVLTGPPGGKPYRP